MTIYDRIKQLREQQGLSQQVLAEKVGFKTASAINKIELGLRDINQTKIILFAKALNTTPAYLMGWETESDKKSDFINLPPPNITEDYTTFPVIGEVAAGYDHIAMEDWEGDTVDISNDYLRGRDKSEFFVLRVKGDSMYPEYQDGDKVLVLKQSTLNYSGQVGVVLYDSESATLKKVEYKQGENWMRLVAINPAYAPKKIENEDLEHCRILGIPKLIIREVEE